MYATWSSIINYVYNVTNGAFIIKGVLHVITAAAFPFPSPLSPLSPLSPTITTPQLSEYNSGVYIHK